MDAVYTWVDDRDEDWLRAKREALASRGADDLHAVAANDSRFHSQDELRYSLRSIDMYADWIRHIYIVTADQVPQWLDLDNPRITLISHRDLFGDRGRLPTFNSHAIESQLHHIDGLSENFVYLNDDVFFGRGIPPSAFAMGNGITKFFMSTVKIVPGPVTDLDRPFSSAAKNNRDLIERRFGRTVTNKLQHTPHALRRSVLFDLEREFPDEVAVTASAQFRSREDLSIAAALAHYYGYVTGRAVPSRLDYLYLDIADPATEERLDQLLQKRDADVFCLNDNDSTDVDIAIQRAMIESFLQSYYPLPSQFEKQPATSSLGQATGITPGSSCSIPRLRPRVNVA